MLYFSTCLIFNQFIYFKLYILGSSPTGNHQLIEQSFSSVLQCDKCHNYLHGLIHQGVVCQGMFLILILSFCNVTHFKFSRVF